MKNLLKGIIIGIGKVLPGVSGAILAILLGVYDKSVYYINNFFNNKRESIKYLLPLGIGLTISVILFSKIISVCLNKYYLYTMMLFIGMIIGCIQEIINKIEKKNYLFITIGFLFFFLISIENINNIYIIKNSYFDIIIFFVSGLLEAIGTVIPGVSSAALLMIIGTYNTVINAIGDVTNIENIIFNIKIIIPFLIGSFFGTIFLVKIIEYFLNNHQNKTYNIILGIVISSIILIIIQTFKYKYSIIELAGSIMFLIIGIIICNLFSKK